MRLGHLFGQILPIVQNASAASILRTKEFLWPMALREPMGLDLPFVDCQSMLLPVARPSYSGTTSHGFWLARPARGCATGE